MTIKTLCPIHHLYYSSTECPLCRDERIERLANRYVKPINFVGKDRKNNMKHDITSSDIEKLKDKFNHKA